jgi:hypothetical protein
MQTYGNFFNPPKPENQIVDNWRIAGVEKLLNKIYEHVFCAGLVLGNQFRQGYRPGRMCKSHFAGMFFGLLDLYGVE